ncbi:hypothetical protein QWI17_15545 [Gilvimarinus sp. SDUM040013]|uniref:Uncharacterized protein n=1 Tax=Gilvimarinus gilvus TaxID=3058038 RepID=A0ABU4RVQ9_9GAMM|nr:hypothetical protein [Gilvimarinus sp. SDUM040013]MDO3387256.1 hypothetical protein [Gilvimarinus sp. SDUM040013]MDX6848945.1 hypothetical protein [Gilvimarinus sp. SDUM040013]
MPIYVILQAALTPLLLSVVLSTLNKLKYYSRQANEAVVMVAWLAISAWIMSGPNLPPRNALDVLWCTTLLLLASPTFPNGYRPTAITLTISAGLLWAAWPALTYKANWASHGMLWLITATGIATLFWQQCQARQHFKASAVGIGAVAGAISLTTIMSGSLKLGLVAASMSFLMFLPALSQLWRQSQLFTHSTQRLSALITGLLLFCTLYADVNVVSFTLALSALLIVQHKQPSRMIDGIIITLSFLTVICAALSEYVFSQSAPIYY